MPKFVFMPPQDDLRRAFAVRLSDELPEYDVLSPETDEDAIEAIRDADAAFGWIPPDALAVAEKLAWLHNPDAGPFFGYYYKELTQHPLTITNPRGIYFDHISHHILMFLLALARGLPWYMDAQRRRIWDKNARKSPYINLADATALINGVGGIGHETARLCNELGMTVIGIEPRPEYELPYVEFHTPDELDALPATRRLRHHNRPTHTRNRRHVRRTTLHPDETFGVLHQHRPRQSVQNRRPRQRHRIRHNSRCRSRRIRTRAAALRPQTVGLAQRADDPSHCRQRRRQHKRATLRNPHRQCPPLPRGRRTDQCRG